MILKEPVLTVSTLGRCCALERTNFYQFPHWVGLVVLEELILTGSTWQDVVILKELIFNNFYFRQDFWS